MSPPSDVDWRLRNGRLISGSLCAQCWGPLVERAQPVPGGRPGELLWVVQCPKGCQPGGFVSAAWVEQRKHDSAMELGEVLANYPELAPEPPSKDELEQTSKLLFGE